VQSRQGEQGLRNKWSQRKENLSEQEKEISLERERKIRERKEREKGRRPHGRPCPGTPWSQRPEREKDR